MAGDSAGLERRRANFFRGTRLDLGARTAPDAAVSEALIVVEASIDAQAKADGRELTNAQRERAKSVAQRLLRALPREQLQNISSSSLLKAITDQSLAVAPVSDVSITAGQTRFSYGDGTGTGGPASRRGVDGLGHPNSSARFVEIAAASETARITREASNEAIHLGMHWALSNPDLLKLGAGAIRTLHDAGVQKERFERMTSDKVGFRATTAVDIAAFAKRHNLTPEQTNRLYDKISDGVEVISGGNKAVQRELDEATRKYINGPDTEESRAALRAAYEKRADTPEKKKAADEMHRAMTKPTEIDAMVTAQRNADVAKRDADRAAADKKIAKAADLFDAPETPADVKSPMKKTAEVATEQSKVAEVKVDEKKVTTKATAQAQPKLT